MVDDIVRFSNLKLNVNDALRVRRFSSYLIDWSWQMYWHLFFYLCFFAAAAAAAVSASAVLLVYFFTHGLSLHNLWWPPIHIASGTSMNRNYAHVQQITTIRNQLDDNECIRCRRTISFCCCCLIYQVFVIGLWQQQTHSINTFCS